MHRREAAVCRVTTCSTTTHICVQQAKKMMIGDEADSIVEFLARITRFYLTYSCGMHTAQIKHASGYLNLKFHKPSNGINCNHKSWFCLCFGKIYRNHAFIVFYCIKSEKRWLTLMLIGLVLLYSVLILYKEKFCTNLIVLIYNIKLLM